MIIQNSNLKTQNYSSKVKSSNLKVRSYQFSLDVIKFVNLLPNKRAFWSIADQLLRSAASIGANLHMIFNDGDLSTSVYNGASWITTNVTFAVVTDNIYDLTIGSNSINTINAPLEIHPLARQDVNFLGGKVTFDTEGNIKVEGNAEFAKDVSVGGVLSARDMAVVRSSPPRIISDAEIIATGSSALVTLAARQTSLKINNANATEFSLIFLTPKTELDTPIYKRTG